VHADNRLGDLEAADGRAQPSVVDGLDTLPLELLETVLHGVERFWRMPPPACDLAGDPQRVL
jgi:hypothetical protein